MYKQKVKKEIGSKVDGLPERILRAFGVGHDSRAFLADQEKTNDTVMHPSIYPDYHMVIQSALLEAEHRKTVALMERQRHPPIY